MKLSWCPNVGVCLFLCWEMKLVQNEIFIIHLLHGSCPSCAFLHAQRCLRHLSKMKYQGGLEAGCCNLCLFQYHFSYLNCHFVFKLWMYYGVNCCSSPSTDCSVICNANLHNAQHSFSPGHTAFSTKFIFMPFNWIIEGFFRPLFEKSHRGGGSWSNKNK